MNFKAELLTNLKLVLSLKLVIFSQLIVPITASAEIVLNSFDYEEKFDSSDYINDIVRVTGGATHTWLPTAGWRGGAAKFTAPLNDDSYCGIGNLLLSGISPSANQVNVRFLVYHGSTWQEYAANNKVFILDGIDARAQRPMIISRDTGLPGEEYVAYGACAGTICNYKGGGLRPDNSDTFRIGNRPLAREEEWISVEVESNVAENYIKVFLHTQDGIISGEYVRQYLFDGTPSNTGWSRLDMIGGYLHASVQADPNNYFMLDEVKLSDSYIGPPAGFLSDPPPKAPILEE